MCSNVVTNVAWVQVKDDETVGVNLVTTAVSFCLRAAMLGAVMGTAIVEGKDIPIAKIAIAKKPGTIFNTVAPHAVALYKLPFVAAAVFTWSAIGPISETPISIEINPLINLAIIF